MKPPFPQRFAESKNEGSFYIYDAMNSSSVVSCVFVVDVINPFDSSDDDSIEASLFGMPTPKGLQKVWAPKKRRKPPDRVKRTITGNKGTLPLEGIT